MSLSRPVLTGLLKVNKDAADEVRDMGRAKSIAKIEAARRALHGASQRAECDDDDSESASN